nr:peptide chain release factor N(5)-glutamine methyltransferase [bacterium]
MTTLREARRHMARLLSDIEDNPQQTADWLMANVLGTNRSGLMLRLDEPLSPSAKGRLMDMVEQRLLHVPLQYIVGSAPFAELELCCRPGVLIPREDTVCLAEGLLEALSGRPAPQVLDVCCGSGCIGLLMASRRADLMLTACDISPDALLLTRDNAAQLGLSARLEALQGDLFAPVAGRRFDAIACNPPYIALPDGPTLAPEVHREPALALFAGQDGLAFYRRLCVEAAAHLVPGGILGIEIGDGQLEAVRTLFAGDWRERALLTDGAGLPRALVFALKEEAYAK